MGRPLRRWSILLWTTYALLGLAAVLAVSGQASHGMTAGDALAAGGLMALLLVLVPYRWARSQTTTWRSATEALGWTASWPAAVGGLACGILLFGTVHPGHGALAGWPVALGYGVTAGIAEELFFRGHLQQRIGWAQVLPFAVLHSSGGLEGIAFPLVAGALLTLLARRGLWASVAAHSTFNALAALPS